MGYARTIATLLLLLAFLVTGQPLTPSELAWVHVTPPRAQNMVLVTVANQVVTNTMVGTDKRSSVTYAIVQSPTNGTLSGVSATTGDFTYTPATNFTGYDFFSFKVTNRKSKAVLGRATIRVLSNAFPVSDCIVVVTNGEPTKVCVTVPPPGPTVICMDNECSSIFGGTICGSVPVGSGQVCVVIGDDCNTIGQTTYNTNSTRCLETTTGPVNFIGSGGIFSFDFPSSTVSPRALQVGLSLCNTSGTNRTIVFNGEVSWSTNINIISITTNCIPVLSYNNPPPTNNLPVAFNIVIPPSTTNVVTFIVNGNGPLFSYSGSFTNTIQ